MVVDSYLKYLFPRPTKTLKLMEAINVLKDFFSLFSVPRRIVSDCGTASKSKSFKKISI